MEENVAKAVSLSNWLIKEKKMKSKIADLIASRKYGVSRNEISHIRQLLKPKQQNIF